MQLWKRTFVRYVALEAPGWVLAGWLAWWLAAKAVVPPWLAALGWSLFVLKDFALYPWLRDAYAVGDRTQRRCWSAAPGSRASGSTRPAMCASERSCGAPSSPRAALPSTQAHPCACARCGDLR